MIGDVVVGVMLRFSSNAVYTLQSANRETLLLQKNLSGVEKRQEAIARNWRMMRGYVAGAFAVGGAMGIGYAINQAAKLQLAMSSTYASIGNLTAKQQSALQQMTLHVSDITAQDATTIAQEMAVAARTGLGSYGRLTALFPLLAKFADVQYFLAMGRGQSFNPADAVSYGIQFAHLFAGLQGNKSPYTQTGMKSILEWINKLSLVQGESPMRALTQAKYFVPMGTALGLKEDDLFPLMALMGQTGFLRGRGGSSLGRAFLGAISAETLTGHSRGVQQSALKELGIIDSSGRSTVITKEGWLNMTKFNDALGKAATNLKPDEFMRDLKAGFGVVATQFLAVLEQPGVKAQLNFIKAQMDRIQPIEEMWKSFMKDLIPAWRLFVTNFTNLGITVFLPTLPVLTVFFSTLAKWIGTLRDTIGDNPVAAWAGVTVAVGAVAASALYSATMLGLFNRAIINTGLAAGAGGAGGSVWGAMGRNLLFLGKLPLMLAALYVIADMSKHLYEWYTHTGPFAYKAPQHSRAYGKSLYQSFMNGPGPITGIPEIDRWLFSVSRGGDWGAFDSQKGFLNSLYGAGGGEFIGQGGFTDKGALFNALYGQQARNSPLVAALTGSGGVAYVIQSESRQQTTSTTQAIHNLGDRIAGIFATLGVNITLQNPDGTKSTIKKLLGSGLPVTSGPRPLHPLQSPRRAYSLGT